MRKYLLAFLLLVFVFQIGKSAKKNFYLEIKNTKIELGIYSAGKLKKERITSFKRNQMDLEKVTQVFGDDDNENILLYFHAMWGGMNVYHKSSLKKLNELEEVDKIISIIWHTDEIGYKGSWEKAIDQGEEISGIIKMLTNKPQSNYSVVCHSMGHRVFQGVIRGINDSSPRFQTILFAAADLNVDVFTNGMEQLPGMSDSIIVLVHEKDRMLKISKILHKRDRLGLHATRHKEQLSKIENLKIINVTHLKKAGSISISNHLYFKKHKAVFKEMERVLAGQG